MNTKYKRLLLVCLAALVIAGIIAGAALYWQYFENQRIARETELLSSELQQVEQMHDLFFTVDHRETKLSILDGLNTFQIETYDSYATVREAVDAAVQSMQNWFYEDYSRYLELHKNSIKDAQFDIDQLPTKISGLEELIRTVSRENVSGINSGDIIASALDEIAFLQYIEYYIDQIQDARDHFVSLNSREGKLLYYYEFNDLWNAFQAGEERIHTIEAVAIAFDMSRDFMYDWFLRYYYNSYAQVSLRADVGTSSITQGRATQLIEELRSLIGLIGNEAILTYTDKEEISERINMLFSDIASAVDRQPPLVSWTRRNTGEILIEGSDQFVRQIEDALAIIRAHPDYYEMVTTYVDQIRPGEHWPEASYMNVWQSAPTVGIGRRVFATGNPVFIAGVIVHEAYHSKLFWEYLNTNNGQIPDSDVWAAGLGHMKVYEVERDFLEEAGASTSIIANVRRRADQAWNRYPQLRGMVHPERFRTLDDQPNRELKPWN